MSTFSRLAAAVCTTLAVLAPLNAQSVWVPNQDPCKLNTGHFMLSGGVLYLKQAAENRFPDQRAGRLNAAHEVLLRAVNEGNQSGNPATWYFLGRYYVEQNDPVGADSAFQRAEKLEPNCKADVAKYKKRMFPFALNNGMTAWQAGKVDSAAMLFQLAARLAPEDASIPFMVSTMYSSQKQLDSAAKYIRLGIEQSGSDTTFRNKQRQAQRDLARAHEAASYDNPAIIRLPMLRQGRDSTTPAIVRDSTNLSTMVARVNEIRGRGRRIEPADLQTFQQESTNAAGRIARQRGLRDSLSRLVSADSASVIQSVAPAIGAYEELLKSFPAEGEAAMKLARLYSASSRTADLNSIVERVATDTTVPVNDLVSGGRDLFGDGQPAAAARLLEAGLKRNPNHRNALYVLTRAYYTLKQQDNLTRIVRKLNEVDPLDRTTVRTWAMVWDVAGNKDSVNRYLALADTGIAWGVTISQFTPSDRVTIVSGSVANLVPRALPATTLVFEFLDGPGNVVATSTVPVAALEPRGRAPLQVRVEQGGAVAWRYKRQ